MIEPNPIQQNAVKAYLFLITLVICGLASLLDFLYKQFRREFPFYVRGLMEINRI